MREVLGSVVRRVGPPLSAVRPATALPRPARPVGDPVRRTSSVLDPGPRLHPGPFESPSRPDDHDRPRSADHDRSDDHGRRSERASASRRWGSAPPQQTRPDDDRWPPLPADRPVIITGRPVASTESPARPAAEFGPAGHARSAVRQPTDASAADLGAATAPWPELPDDAVLWQAPRPQHSAERIRRLDAEQRGA
ncbi:hypothetical protein [Microlunatus speluncae]|uniref:hypothetical protein n=1 Tax=Microlunatus speluncae TaxID=2594267 RepID=UPI0012666319|nr:hypothetical protein [Microlunatus speluncae]